MLPSSSPASSPLYATPSPPILLLSLRLSTTAFRPLLFLDNAQLSHSSNTSDVPTLILLHHILSRSCLPLPHQLHGWTEAEYVRWLNEHGEKERIKVVEGVVRTWEEGVGKSGRSDEEEEEGREFVAILRSVLGRAAAGST